jgi:hypothetical protein
MLRASTLPVSGPPPTSVIPTDDWTITLSIPLLFIQLRRGRGFEVTINPSNNPVLSMYLRP